MADEDVLIDTFQEITGLNNRELSRSVLGRHGWNVDSAVDSFLSGNIPNNVDGPNGGEVSQNRFLE